VTYARHRVDQLKHNVEVMQVVAPRAGTVVFPTGWRGDKKKVGDQVWRMETIVQIVGLGKMVGNGAVDEVDIARVAEHQPVALRLDALPDAQLRGSVESIAKSVHAKGQSDPSLVVSVKIAIDRGTTALRPGMRFRATIETERIANVVQVPAEAVFVTPDGPVVYRDRGGQLDRVSVVLGRRNATAIEVVSGLAPGDRVSRDPRGEAR
jgi:HlyD family secretion protein